MNHSPLIMATISNLEAQIRVTHELLKYDPTNDHLKDQLKDLAGKLDFVLKINDQLLESLKKIGEEDA